MKSSFTLRGRNPDILTCIANLSNDEVFTPPELANQIIDNLSRAWAKANNGENIWTNKDIKFLDPCTKSGVFLREITNRLVLGLEEEIPDLQDRVNHILTKQVFGIGLTQLTSLLSRRSLYCSKYANGKHSVATEFDNEAGNVWFERTEHKWRDGKCAFCGASKASLDRGDGLETHAYAFIHSSSIHDQVTKLFGANMQFDVIIGNPPYQLDDGGHGVSAAPIYQKFVEQAKKLEPRYLTMVIPSRWFSGGKGLDDFREAMLGDSRLRSIDDFLSAADVFPGVGLKGGVCYFLWEKEKQGLCKVSTHFKDWPVSTMERQLKEKGADIFIRFNEGVSILKKVISCETSQNVDLKLPDNQRFDRMVSVRKPFGLETKFKGQTKKNNSDDLLVYQNGGIGFIKREQIQTGLDLIDRWKIFIGRAAPGTGNRDTYPHRIISTPFVAGPGTISSETYLCIGPFDTKKEANSALSYLSCRLTRLLILLHKPSQDTTRRVYTFVPRQSWTKTWTDEELYKKYKLSQKEIAFIEQIVRPLEFDTDLLGDMSVEAKGDG